MSSNEYRADESGAPRPKRQKTGGFKWKEKKTTTELDERKEQGGEGLHRGYRDRSPRRDRGYKESDRDRSPRRDDARARERSPGRRDHSERKYGQDDPRDRYSSRKDHDRAEGDHRRTEPEENQSTDTPPNTTSVKSTELSASAADKFGLPSSKSSKKDKPKKPRIAAPTEPMIVVNINDRLGTKAAIPCLASDSVKAFKAVVAAHIGRKPHEIMLKRQGERPFKDQLTLEDYGVSSGVQLDLEIDTGD